MLGGSLKEECDLGSLDYIYRAIQAQEAEESKPASP